MTNKHTHGTASLKGLMLVGISLLAACQSEPEWKMVWNDEFNENGVINTESWSKIPRGKSDWNNFMSDYDSLYAVQDGNLILRGCTNTALPDDTASFLTGGVFTKDKVSFTNGRIEIHAKLFGAKGAWPAFWLLPQGKQWPTGGEIDIMERLSHESIAYQTVHSYYTVKLGISDNPKKGSTGEIDPDGYNTYAVEMYADSLSFYINNKHTFTYPRIQTDKEGQFPFNDQPFYLLLDMQLGGAWVGAVEPKELPVEMHIDWVRFYKKK